MQLGQSQRLAQMQVLSPQMQQSLAILQAPVLELKALVDQELEQNPVLEEIATPDTEQEQQEGKPDSEKEETANLADPAEPPADTQFDPAQEKGPADPVDDFQAEFDKLVQMDQEWRDHFAQTNLPARHSAEDEERRQFMFDSLVAETSLQEILLEQVRTSDLPAERRPIAEMIVGNIDDYGYLQSSVEELAFSTGIPAEQILEVLKVIQTFQPPGVGARDLRECLLLQLERAGKQDSQEYRVVRDHMDALGRRRYPEIARALNVEVEDAQAIAERISHLDPRPGRAFLPEAAGQYIVPEVFVTSIRKMTTEELCGNAHALLDKHFNKVAPQELYVSVLEQMGKHPVRMDNSASDIFKEVVGKLQNGDFDGALKSLQKLAGLTVLTDEQEKIVNNCIAQIVGCVCRMTLAKLRKHFDYDVALKELREVAKVDSLEGEQKEVIKDCTSLVRDNELIVSTNNDQIPHLRISNTYKDLMSDAGSTTEVRQYIRTKIQAGKFLIKSLHQRQQTILNIARVIVERQREFMEKGVSGLKPLTMAAVAEVVGVHETTVSRAVSGKYMETPQGVFEMRYFFTSGFTTAGGETVSNTSIKDTLAGIIKEEDPSSPLSDETIVKMLTEKGIPIARRTVAKYRAELNILPSNLRRVY